MARLIYADALIAWIKESMQQTSKVKAIIAKIKTMPTIDAVSVVRCRECIHYGRDSERNTYGCNLHSIGMTPSDFCSYGEREGE